MRILIIVDSFKGSLSSKDAGKAISIGIKNVFPESITDIIPIADGGEGTVDALLSATGGELINTTVTSPLGENINSYLGKLEDGTIILEMAAASGLSLVPPAKRNPLLTTTYGTGELIKKALDLGAKNIVIGIGGSATNDGGAGMAQALGIQLLNNKGEELPFGGGALEDLASIDMSNLDKRLKDVKVTVICDVDNPLCGTTGASHVYGPQKGANSDTVKQLDKNLRHFAEIIHAQLGKNIIDIPGAGAAGGLGGGLIAFTNAELKSGIETILDTMKIDEILHTYDVVITGEGRIDQQSLYGKVPSGVVKRAKKHAIPCIAICGSVGEGVDEFYKQGLAAIIPIVNGPITLEEAMLNASKLTANASERAFRLIKLGQEL